MTERNGAARPYRALIRNLQGCVVREVGVAFASEEAPNPTLTCDLKLFHFIHLLHKGVIHADIAFSRLPTTIKFILRKWRHKRSIQQLLVVASLRHIARFILSSVLAPIRTTPRCLPILSRPSQGRRFAAQLSHHLAHSSG